MQHTEDATALGDDALMDRLATGDMTMLGELYLRHSTMVHGALRRFAPGIPDAQIQELSQEIFLLLKKKAIHYRQEGKFRSFLYGIAVKRARTWQRNHLLRRRLLGAASLAPVQPWQTVPQNCPSEKLALRETVMQMLQRLPEKHRAVLILHSVEEFSSEEIAHILGISAAAVRTRLFRARQLLLDSVHSDAWLQSLRRES